MLHIEHNFATENEWNRLESTKIVTSIMINHI